jgi:hypothetical protein
MNEEMASLYESVQRTLDLEKEYQDNHPDWAAEKQERYAGTVGAYQHVLEMILSTSYLFGHTKSSGIKPTDWGLLNRIKRKIWGKHHG